MIAAAVSQKSEKTLKSIETRKQYGQGSTKMTLLRKGILFYVTYARGLIKNWENREDKIA